LPNLEAQIAKVRDIRATYSGEKSKLDAAYNQWLTINKDAFLCLDSLKESLIIEEETLREMTIIAYQETGNKKPAPGVSVRMTKKAEYNATEALLWAKKHDACLSLDEKAYKTALIAGIFADAPGRVVEEPQATIAKELI